MSRRIKWIYLVVLSVAAVSFGAQRRCGTADAIRRFYSKEPMSPPDLPFYFDTEHFRIWYDTAGYNQVFPGDADSNGIPDYVDSTGIYLENVWHILIDSVGYRQPLPDTLWAGDSVDFGGDPRVDVYLANTGAGFFGETVPRVANSDGVSLKATAYLEIQSDMRRISDEVTDPYPLLKVTCAHEFFHAVQFAYRFPELSEYSYFVWWMEASAVFDEEFCYDEVNDYYNYLPSFQEAPEVPLFTANYNGSIEYGAVLFPIFVEEYFAPEGVRFTGQCIKRIWELCETEPPVEAVRLFAEEKGSSLEELYGIFSNWRFRTADQWTPGYFAEGQNYPLPACDSVDLSEDNFWGDVSLPPLATHYFVVPYAAESYGILARLSNWTDYAAAGLGVATVGFIPDDPVDSFWVCSAGECVGVPGIWQYRAVGFFPLVYSAPSQASLSISIAKSESLSVPVNAQNEFFPPYPNPACGLPITFSADVRSPGEFVVMVFSSNGQVVWEHRIEIDLPQRVSVEWDCRNKGGKKVAPGVYIYKIFLSGEKFSGRIFICD